MLIHTHKHKHTHTHTHTLTEYIGSMEDGVIIMVGGNVGTILGPAISFGWPLLYSETDPEFVRVFLAEVFGNIYMAKIPGKGDIYEWLAGMLTLVLYCYLIFFIIGIRKQAGATGWKTLPCQVFVEMSKDVEGYFEQEPFYSSLVDPADGQLQQAKDPFVTNNWVCKLKNLL